MTKIYYPRYSTRNKVMLRKWRNRNGFKAKIVGIAKLAFVVGLIIILGVL
jgi:hypothetical protein